MINNLNDLHKAIVSKEPLSVVRMGNVEITALLQEQGIYSQMYTNAGFYGSPDIYLKWKNKYVKAILNSDVILDVFTCPSFIIQGDLMVKLNSWKPTLPYNEDPIYWAKLLEMINEPVGVVSFFKADITRQLGKMDKIWNLPKLKNKNIVVVKAFNTIKGNEPHENWLKTFVELQKRVDKHPHIRIWLVSCGCYGLPLCDYIKSKGCRAIYVGGLLQLLFGLKGKRWDERKEVVKYYNKHWRYPEEKPANAEHVEGGCYWKAKSPENTSSTS